MFHKFLRAPFIVAAIASTIVAYGIYSQRLLTSHVGASCLLGGSRNHFRQLANEAQINLNASLQSPISLSDFTAMADRMASFARLNGALMQDPNVSSEPTAC